MTNLDQTVDVLSIAQLQLAVEQVPRPGPGIGGLQDSLLSAGRANDFAELRQKIVGMLIKMIVGGIDSPKDRTSGGKSSEHLGSDPVDGEV